jgi:hypothetical protein
MSEADDRSVSLRLSEIFLKVDRSSQSSRGVWKRESGKRVGSNLCKAPEGPFRQIGPDPFSAFASHDAADSSDASLALFDSSSHLLIDSGRHR